MAYDPPTESELVEAALDAYKNNLDGADTRRGGELWLRSQVIAQVGALLAYGLKYVEKQIFPNTADEDMVARFADLWEVDRLQPTAADEGGAISYTGVTGTPVPSGLTILADDGTEFTNTGTATINPSGTYTDIIAVDTGEVGNLEVGTELTIQSPPSGIDATVEVVAELTGGTDLETVERWAERIVERIRNGNGSNTAADYERWAESIDGVLEAHCLPTRRGPGTVSVAVFSADASGNRTPASLVIRGEVLAYIESVRPVTAEVDCPVVTEVALDVEITDVEVEAGFDEDEVLAAIETAVSDYIWSLESGESQLLTQLGRAVANVAGCRDYTIVSPAGDTAVTLDGSTVEILVPGTVSASAA